MKTFPAILISIILIASTLASLSLILDNPEVSDPGEMYGEGMTPTSQTAGLLNSVFTANHGQVGNDDVLFTTSSAGGRVAFTRNSYSMFLTERLAGIGAERDDAPSPNEDETARETLVTIFFIDGNPVIPQGQDPTQWRSNYFRGNDSTEWMTGVPNYRQIVYENLWDGIDLVYSLKDDGLKYDIILHPDADPRDIMFRVAGHEELTVDESGTLVLRTRLGNDHAIRDSGLVAFYEDDHSDSIPARFHLIDGDTFSFQIQNWDAKRTVIIDPLVYSTFLGGGEWEVADGITVDNEGCVYLIGNTDSSDFPTTPGAYDTTFNGEYDVFITKLGPDGDTLEYSTYIGQGSDWSKFVIAVDDDGYAYAVGSTSNANFPTTDGAYDTTHGGSDDVFVIKLSPTGDSLIYSTFLGDTKSELGYAIAIDGDGFAYVTGCTSSTDFPTTPGAYDTTYNFQRDVFVTKLNQAGDSLVYSTFLGSNKNEDGKAIAVDDDGYAIITGGTYSTGFPTTNDTYDGTHNGDWDGYVTKLSQSGDSLEYSTFLGGSSGEEGSGIAIDDNGNAFITGRTRSLDYPTTEHAFDTTHNGGYGDVFVTKLDATGEFLQFSTFVGGSERETGEAIAVGPNGYVFVTGSTNSDDFPVVAGSFDTSFNGGDDDAIVFNLRPMGDSLEYSTFLGGSESENGLAIAVDGDGHAYVTGRTDSDDFPTTPGAYDTEINSYTDSFITKLRAYLAPVAIIDSISPNPALDTDLVRFEGHSNDDDSIQRYVWRSSLDGELHNDTTVEFETDTLSLGEHSIFFRVQDDQDEWSEEISIALVITERPNGYIDSIAPNPALDIDEIRYEGHGTDDGTIERYAWRSNSDGEFYNGTNTIFTNSVLSNGTHDIYLRVLDNHGFWSDEVSTTLVINGKPRCEILDISHSTALDTDTVSFEGFGSDDGTVARYMWTSDRDGELYKGTEAGFSTDALSLGDHTINLTVQDDSGVWSEPVFSYVVIHQRPAAVIDSILPADGLEQTERQFTGHGEDDNAITQFSWRSDLDGILSGQAEFSTTALSNGTHMIFFKVLDEYGIWSNEVSTTITVNGIPRAEIISIVPEFALQGETVEFSGTGTDDGGITGYAWRSDLDGNLSSDASFSTNSLSNGTHTIFLKVMDDSGIWAEEVPMQITINGIPTARIASVSNSTAYAGDSITFHGNGTDDGGLSRFVWSSDLDGELSKSSAADLTIANLSVGNHTISLLVQDTHGTLSEPVTMVVTIMERPDDSTPPTITIATPKNGATVSGNVTFSGTAYDETRLSKIEFRILGASEWAQTQTKTDWSFIMDTTDLEDAEYTMEFRASDGVQYSEIATVTFTVDNTGGGGPGDEEGDDDSILMKKIGPLPLVGYVGLLVVVLILVLAIGKRGGKKTSDTSDLDTVQNLIPNVAPTLSAPTQMNPPAQPPYQLQNQQYQPAPSGQSQQYSYPAQPQQPGSGYPQQPVQQYQQSSPIPAPTQGGNWSCPQCSASVEGQYAFCMSCGYRKES